MLLSLFSKYSIIYLKLAKIRVMMLVIFTSIIYASFFLKNNFNLENIINAIKIQNFHLYNEFFKDIQHFIICIIALSLAACACGILNMAIESDLDFKMQRTKNRPIPLLQISKKHAFILGYILAILSLYISYIYLYFYVSIMLFLSIFIYILLYTIILKQHSIHDIEIGSISGALPPIIMSYALDLYITKESLLLFLIIFFWTMPHSYSLGIHLAEDYKLANIPTIHQKIGLEKTYWIMFFYACITCILASYLAYNINLLCLFCSLIFNFYLLKKNYQLIYKNLKPFLYFKASIVYLSSLCCCYLIFNIFIFLI
ncbi:MAG: protoheme IX farnesyltransferase [Rickettsiales bacterium]